MENLFLFDNEPERQTSKDEKVDRRAIDAAFAYTLWFYKNFYKERMENAESPEEKARLESLWKDATQDESDHKAKYSPEATEPVEKAANKPKKGSRS